MKIKKILIILILITSSSMIGCSSSISSEDKVIDSVVIDEDAKETANSNNVININKIAITENLIDKNGVISRDVERLIEIQYTEDFGEGEGTIYQSQFPKLYISSLSIGTITDEIQDNRNIVYWENKDIDGRLLIEYMGSGETFKILKDNKVYMVDNNYNLKEITAYKKLIEETNGDINRFEQSYDGNLDIYYMDNNNDKIGIIDTLNDKYYEINKRKLGNIENYRLNILMAEKDKIYVSLIDTANEAASILGYIENNKLITFFDRKSTIKVKITGDVVYSTNNILFSGAVEDDYGIWNYNIESKKLEKQLELKYNSSYFKVSKDKSFIIITNTNSYEDFNISLARINDKLETSNFQELTNSILPNVSNDKWFTISGWSNKSDKFYVKYVDSKIVDGGQKIEDIYYEIYEVK